MNKQFPLAAFLCHYSCSQRLNISVENISQQTENYSATILSKLLVTVFFLIIKTNFSSMRI